MHNCHYYYYYYYYQYYYLKHLSLKASQLKQACRPAGTLTYAVKQSHCACCLTGHVLKGVVGRREQHENDVKRHEQSPKSCLSKSLLRVLSWCQPQPYTQELTSSVLANWYNNSANKLHVTKTANQSPAKYNMQKDNQLVVCPCFISWTQ